MIVLPQNQIGQLEQEVEPLPSGEIVQNQKTKLVLAKHVRKESFPYTNYWRQNCWNTNKKSRDSTCLIVDFEPRTFKDALDNEDWINAMNEEIDQIEKNNIWSLVPRPANKNVIGTK